MAGERHIPPRRHRSALRKAIADLERDIQLREIQLQARREVLFDVLALAPPQRTRKPKVAPPKEAA
ncbi:MAG TPA: hypothetical protein VK573_12270 [Gemmatimonadales bacterium]|nr:hypothetical protein [Gemmatimonadales bacterium]